MDHEEDLNTLKTLIQSAVLLVIPLMLIYVQPDMKNTITVTVLFCILIYIAGLSYKIIGGVALIAIPLAIIFLSIIVQPDQKLIQDYQRNRIMSFLYPENEEYADDIEQQNNSKTAIASGELVGRAFSNDTSVTSVMMETLFLRIRPTLFCGGWRAVRIYRLYSDRTAAVSDHL